MSVTNELKRMIIHRILNWDTIERCGLLRYVLVNKYLISIRIDNHKDSWPNAAFVRFVGYIQSLGFQLLLQFSNIGERIEWCAVLIPTRIER